MIQVPVNPFGKKKIPAAPASPAAQSYMQNAASKIMSAPAPMPVYQTQSLPQAPAQIQVSQPPATPPASSNSLRSMLAGAANTALKQTDLPTPGSLGSDVKPTTANQSYSLHVAPQINAVAPDPNALSAPGAITDAGKAYQDKVMQGIQGNDARVTNAQASEDTNASRRQYLANKTTQESLGQGQFAVGSAQYQRAMDQSQAGVNSANQQGQAGVNELARTVGNENLNRAQGLEGEQYNRALTERTHTDTKALVGKGDAESLINSVEDPKAKYYLNSIKAQGGDVNAAYAAMMDNGTIKEQYRSATPVQNIKSDAEDWIKQTQPGLQAGTPEYQKAVTDRMTAIDSAQNQPLTDAGNARTAQELTGLINQGKTLDATQFAEALRTGAAKNFAPGTVPLGASANDYLGKQIGIGGQQYTYLGTNKITRDSGGHHTDFAVVQDKDGNIKYAVNGVLSDKPPINAGGPVKDQYVVWDKTQNKMVNVHPDNLTDEQKKEYGIA